MKKFNLERWLDGLIHKMINGRLGRMLKLNERLDRAVKKSLDKLDLFKVSPDPMIIVIAVTFIVMVIAIVTTAIMALYFEFLSKINWG